MGKTTTKIRNAIMFVLLGFILFLPVDTYAISSGGISVLPAQTKEYPGIRSWFVYDEAEPGSTIIDKVEIINDKNQEANINIAVLDGAVTKDGGYTLVGRIDENKDMGTWASLSKNLLVMPPKSRESIDLEIKIPENADVGSHPGGVVIWEDPNYGGKKESAGQLSVITRVAARVYITVPGDIVRNIDISNVRHTIKKNVLYFNMTIENLGNIQIVPIADVGLTGFLGDIGVQKDAQIGLMLRGTSIESKIAWQKKAPKFGRFTADIRIHYGEKDFKNEWVEDQYIDIEYTFWLIPWMLIVWWLGGLFVLLFIYRSLLWIKVRQRLNTKTKEHKVKKGETLTTIAHKYDINTKKLARFNMLKWPYDIFPGDVLLVPQGKLTKEEKITEAKSTTKKTDLGGQNYEPVIAEPGDTLADVAVFANSDVRTIASINKLKWPYKLTPGQELMVPIMPKPKSIKKKSTAGRSVSRLSRRGKSKPKRRKPPKAN